MIFYCLRKRDSPPSDATFPCVVLKSDGWNDYGYLTLFHAVLFRSPNKEIELGETKILQLGEYQTELPKQFHRLTEKFCSLGQSLSYYQQLKKLGKGMEGQILTALRDIAAHPQYAEPLQDEKGFQDSLLRSSEAEKLFREVRYALGEMDDPNQSAPIEFTYSVKHIDATAPHVVNIRFGDRELLPNRLILFIGKNGAGKTWLLSHLAADISGDGPERGRKRFTPHRPRFSKVIAVSYSAFDLFRRPPKGEKTFSYQYCGIYNAEGNLLKRQALLNRIANAHEQLKKMNRHMLWTRVLTDVFSSFFAKRCDEFLSGREDNHGRWLSSGQTILLTVLTELLAVLEAESLILYDEPELHLHPNAMSGLMRGIERILSAFNCYAILATHSPLILQQVPSHYVRVFTRIQNQTMISPLAIESFGENLTLLTEEVFQVNAMQTIFQEWADRVVTKESEPDILSAFENRLSFNARTMLRSLTTKSDEDRDDQ